MTPVRWLDRVRARMVVVAILAGLWTAACEGSGPDPVGPEGAARQEEPAAVDPRALVSDPIQLEAGVLLHAGSRPSLLESSDGEGWVFASLPPGSVLDASAVVMRNGSGESSDTVLIVEGGFDPVAVRGTAGDTLHFRFFDGSLEIASWSRVVPRRTLPDVVRTSPARGKRDVALRVQPFVVFSEPMGSETLASVRLMLSDGDEGAEDQGVEGVVAFRDSTHLVVELTPSEPLLPSTEYALVVTREGRDLDGESLESTLRITFTTVDAPSAPPVLAGLAFSRWDGSAVQIYAMNPDGSGLRLLGSGMDPSFSPDGTMLAFWRVEGGLSSVYVMNGDGTGVTRVTSGYQPTWSPDGRRLAYGCGGICLIDIDGRGYVRLTPPARESALGWAECLRDGDPAWSPNGSTIAFTRWPDARLPMADCLPLGAEPFEFRTEIRLIDVDGTNLRSLRDGAGATISSAGWPAWSPDGTLLAFFYTNGAQERIDIAGADGVRLLTAVRRSPPRWERVLGSPDWSPDGAQLVFGTPDGWGFADSAGSGATQLVTTPFGFVPPSLTWSWSRVVTP
jgi:hypothetical protein